VDKLDAALTESRAALKGLRGSGSHENDLAKQLAGAASDTQVPGITFRLVITGESRAIRPAIQYEFFRIGSEAISNALRHSGASTLWVDLEYLNGLRMVVRDDGKGIPEEVLRSGREGHFGLEGMRERADRIGASLGLHTRVGAGTKVSLMIPGHIAFQARPSTQSAVTRALSRIMSLRNRRSA
jgi:signal transduction histidine kinase